MALVIDIRINENILHQLIAVNVTQQCGGQYGIGEQVYKVTYWDGHREHELGFITHDYHDMAGILSEKMIKRFNQREDLQ